MQRANRPIARRRHAGLPRPRWPLALVLWLPAACRVPPYEPANVPLPAGADAFARVVEVVRARFPRFPVCDLARRRLQSDWVDTSEGATPGRRRVTVFPTAGDRIGIVVEVSWLRQTLAASPYWSAPVGDRAAERDLAAAVRAAFAAP